MLKVNRTACNSAEVVINGHTYVINRCKSGYRLAMIGQCGTIELIDCADLSSCFVHIGIFENTISSIDVCIQKITRH